MSHKCVFNTDTLVEKFNLLIQALQTRSMHKLILNSAEIKQI